MADDAANGDAPPASPPDPTELSPSDTPPAHSARPPADRAEPDRGEPDRGESDQLRRAPGSMPPRAGRGWLPSRRSVGLSLTFLAPCVVIAFGVFFIVRGGAQRSAALLQPSASAASSGAGPAGSEPSSSASASATSETPPLEKSVPGTLLFDDENGESEPTPVKRAAPRHFATVQLAAAGSCSTSSVDGLSRQIIEQARCIKQNAFVPLPTRPNLVLSAHVFPYLELEARNHLLKALEAHPTGKMTINSALRTVAQQYLVWRWAAGKRCGVQLATPPGDSNHEIGIALDVAEASEWRPALEAQEFRWLGATDRVHFDYKGSDTPPHTARDVLAFQTLWNRNHPTDAITESGHYSPETELRLKKSPSDGFPIGPTCSKSKH